MVLQNTHVNQKLMNSYVFTYHGSEVRDIRRSITDMVSLPDAIASVGFPCIGLPWGTASNPKMETDRADKDRPRIQVVGCFLIKKHNFTAFQFRRFIAYCNFKCLNIHNNNINT